MKKRGFEGSAKDKREDKKLAKQHGMSLKSWERSSADKKHDAPKRKARKAAKEGPGHTSGNPPAPTTRMSRIRQMEKSDLPV